jgi:hypothetical protein
MKKRLRGAAKITHAINNYGGNKGMNAGLIKFAKDNQNLGYQKAFSEIQQMSFIERLFVNTPKARNK